MPTYLTEFTDRDEHGRTLNSAGPCIYVNTREEADKICTYLFADPHGEMPLRVIGALEDMLPAALDVLGMQRRRDEIRAEMLRIIKETPR